MLDLSPFQGLKLRGGFVVVQTQLTAGPLLDPIERAASAQTLIRGRQFWVLLRADLDERELSISMYHEVLEAATIALQTPPESVLEFNEGDFESAAVAAHEKLGLVTPATLNEMLAEFGF